MAKRTQAGVPAHPVTAAHPTSVGHRARRPADHDVLGRGSLQRQRVDEDVEEQGGSGDDRRHQVDQQPEPDEAGDPKRDAEHQAARLDPVTGRAAGGTAHDLVDVPVGPGVEGVGPSRPEGPADERGHHQPGARPPLRRGPWPAPW